VRASGTRLESNVGIQPIYTIGHSTRTVDELAEMLRAHNITTLVDIRTIRRSRANPQFNGDVLGAAIAPIAYTAIPALGGRRGKPKEPPTLANDAWQVSAFRNYADYALTPEFDTGLDELLAIAKREPVAIMCAEAVWWRCHRRIVADHLLARGIPVTHLVGKAEPATLTPFAKVKAGRVYYPRTTRARSTAAARAPRRTRASATPARPSRRPARAAPTRPRSARHPRDRNAPPPREARDRRARGEARRAAASADSREARAPRRGSRDPRRRRSSSDPR
jgi:hypothetical protein